VVGRLIAKEVADGAADGLLAPCRPAASPSATRVMPEVESVVHDPPRQDRSN
jgi:hypothetical protein